MPQLPWEEEDARFCLAFFPLIGAVIGGLICLLNLFPGMKDLPTAVRILLTILIPIAVTGGFHLDGFMDAEDALRSYASPEKRLEIMKDPHIGAFAVIGLIRVLLLFGAAVTAILLQEEGREEILILSGIFVIARCLSALSSLYLRKAKREGMLYESAGKRQRSVVAGLCVLFVASAAFILWADLLKGMIVLAVFAGWLIRYRHICYRIYGGVTGDTAGYFLVTAETATSCALALAGWFLS